MTWRSKKTQHKGWTVDTEDEKPVGLRERFGGNDLLWVGMLVAIVIGSVAGILISSRHPGNVRYASSSRNYAGGLSDAPHRDFVDKIERIALGRGVKIRAEFLTTTTLKLTMPGDVDSDDLRFLSRAAALGLNNQLRIEPIILTYVQKDKGSTPIRVAETKWDTVTGNFVVSDVR